MDGFSRRRKLSVAVRIVANEAIARLRKRAGAPK
jgi:hypothetical protein